MTIEVMAISIARGTPRAPAARAFMSIKSRHVALPRVAVLYQALEPPLINGTRKPKKPGGYRDSGADIAYVLRHKCHIETITPSQTPNASIDADWCFPDTEEGILQAVGQGATYLWANTILFAQHPIQISPQLDDVADHLHLVGQAPILTELYDDKNFVNELLRARLALPIPKAQLIDGEPSLQKTLSILSDSNYPVIGKPARGRGSYGVRVCQGYNDLQEHVRNLLAQHMSVMVEEYLAGQEGTISVMPPSQERTDYWALPVVERFNHQDGIAPYNGVVAVTQNSRVVHDTQAAADPNYEMIQQYCVDVARLLHATAPIRVDVRRTNQDAKAPFAIFDVNMKPNMTGPGRKGREDQASLIAMAASGIDWDYPRLLMEILASSKTLQELRSAKRADLS